MITLLLGRIAALARSSQLLQWSSVVCQRWEWSDGCV